MNGRKREKTGFLLRSGMKEVFTEAGNKATGTEGGNADYTVRAMLHLKCWVGIKDVAD